MKLNSEFETTCPCCKATLVIDTNLRRIVRPAVLNVEAGESLYGPGVLGIFFEQIGRASCRERV